MKVRDDKLSKLLPTGLCNFHSQPCIVCGQNPEIQAPIFPVKKVVIWRGHIKECRAHLHRFSRSSNLKKPN